MKSNIKNFLFFLKNLSRKIKSFILIGFIIYFLIYSVNLVLPLLQKKFINNSIINKSFSYNYFYQIVLFYFLLYISEIISSLYDKKLSKEIYVYLRLKFIEFFKFFRLQKVKEKGSSYFVQKFFMGTQHADMYSVLFSNLFTFIYDLLLSFAIYFIIFRWLPVIGLIALFNSISDVFIISIMTKIYAKENRKEMEGISLSAKEISKYINSFISIGIFSIFSYFKNLFKDKFFKSLKHFDNYKNNQIILLTIIQNFKTISLNILILYFLIFAIVKSKIDFGTFVAINLYLEYLKKPQKSYFSVSNNIASLTSFFNGFFKYFKELLLPFDLIFKNPLNIGETYNNYNNTLNKDVLKFESIVLKKEDKVLIDSFNFTITEGKKIGLVGLSGEGKTLVVKLLLKEFFPDKGKIFFKGNNLNNIVYGYYLSRINCILQNTEIIGDDLINNITLGKKIIKNYSNDNIEEDIQKNVNNNIKNNIIVKENIVLNEVETKLNNSFYQIKNLFNKYYLKLKKKNVYKKYMEYIKNKEIQENNIVNYNKIDDIKSQKIFLKLNKISLNYLFKITKKIHFTDQMYEFLCLLGLFLKEEHINFINILSFDNCFLYFIKALKQLKNLNQKTIKKLSKLYFNKFFIYENELNDVIKKLELSKLNGRNFGESGYFISGGEKQKIGLARFLLKKDFDFFLIDEAFSSLDAINETKFVKELKHFLKNKTGIIISHKLNVLKELCDELIVIDKGKIIETGIHIELINKNGLYKKLYDNFKDIKENL